MAEVWVAAEDNILVRADAIGEIKSFSVGQEARVSVKTEFGSYVVSVSPSPASETPDDLLAIADLNAGRLVEEMARHSEAEHYAHAIIDFVSPQPAPAS